MDTISLNKDENIATGWKRLITEQCQSIAEVLRSRKAPPERIHDIRKSLKKIRGLLRAVKEGFPGYTEENIFFRDAGRAVSKLRDYQAVQDTLVRLYATKDHPANKSTCRTIAKKLDRAKSTLEKQMLKKEKVLESINLQIQEKLTEIEDWSLERSSFDVLSSSITKVYKKGYRLRKIAEATGKSEDFHEWRKQAKYLRYQLEFLNPLWPNLMTFWEGEMHQLTDYIGEGHDLVVLQEMIETEGVFISNTKERLAFDETVAYHKSLCSLNALDLGSKCYSERPKNFKQRLEAIWEAYQYGLSLEKNEKAPL
ncbi:CHAD domain-containing protein [Echinicola sediminis]